MNKYQTPKKVGEWRCCKYMNKEKTFTEQQGCGVLLTTPYGRRIRFNLGFAWIIVNVNSSPREIHSIYRDFKFVSVVLLREDSLVFNTLTASLAICSGRLCHWDPKVTEETTAKIICSSYFCKSYLEETACSEKSGWFEQSVDSQSELIVQ